MIEVYLPGADMERPEEEISITLASEEARVRFIKSKYKVIGTTSHCVATGYEWYGSVVVYDVGKDEYLECKYNHCSCAETCDVYDDERLFFLCSSEGIWKLIDTDLDPRVPDLCRKIDWTDYDAEALLVVVRHLSTKNTKAMRYLDSIITQK